MKNVAVIGLGRFGSKIAVTLSQKGFDVIGIDEDEDIVDDLKDLIDQAIVLDSTDEKAMRAVQVDTVDIAVVAIGSNIQSSLLTTALLQKMSIEEIHVRAISTLQQNILDSMGIKHMINIEEEMGKQLSSSLTLGKTGRFVQISEKHVLMELNVPTDLVGRSLKELDLRSKHRINIVGIKQFLPEVDDDGDIQYISRMTDVPDPEYPLEESDVLVVVGTDDSINKFVKVYHL